MVWYGIHCHPSQSNLFGSKPLHMDAGPHIRMNLKTELRTLTARGLMFQPGPVFGRSNCKTLGCCIAYLLVSHMRSLFFLQCLLLWMSLWLPVCQLSSPVVEERE